MLVSASYPLTHALMLDEAQVMIEEHNHSTNNGPMDKESRQPELTGHILWLFQ